MVYSFAARLERGETRRQIFAHAIKRSLILIAIGPLVNASPNFGPDLHTWRFEGVTQRIGLCYFFAAHLDAAGLSTANASLVYSLAAVGICWILLWFLWRGKDFFEGLANTKRCRGR